jgi:uncharacterized protein
MKIAVTGATGFIGRRLTESLLKDRHEVCALVRQTAALPPAVRAFAWDDPEEALAGAAAVVHLAGEPVSQRWTPAVKERIRSSRIDGTRRLVEALSTVSDRPPVLICASAVGIYGSRGDETLTEQSAPGRGFLAEVCTGWEAQADLAESLGLRVAKIRIGVVLGRGGGALARMLPPFKAGVGGKLASGRQWMSWIHLDDLVRMIRFLVENPISGPVNGTSPHPVTNADFTRALAAALHRPALFPVPGFILKIGFGEMAEILLASQRVLPRAAESAGFRFEYERLGSALATLL